MPGSFTSVFGEPDEYEARLRAAGVVGLVIVGQGQFQARLTEIALHRLRLAAGEERPGRIAFVEVPAGEILVALALGPGRPPVWGGIAVGSGDIVTVGPGERLHALAEGPARWGTIRLLQADLLDYGRRLNGDAFVVPPGIVRWRPPRAANRSLHDLCRAALRLAEARSAALADRAAAHGLEQQLIHALVESLAAATADREMPAARRHRRLLARFEDLLAAGSLRAIAELGAALGISNRLLRECCKTHLGMSPSGYRRRRAMQEVHRALRRAAPDTSTVAELAGRHGFHDPGRFAGRYRAIYSELPSQTLRRAPHMKFSR